MTARTQGGPLASTLTIDERGESLADSVVTRNYAMQPDLAKRYGPAGREKCVADARRHLSYLAEAIRTNSPGLFADYVVWAKVVLAGLAIPATDLTLHLQILRDVLGRELDLLAGVPIGELLDRRYEKFRKMGSLFSETLIVPEPPKAPGEEPPSSPDVAVETSPKD